MARRNLDAHEQALRTAAALAQQAHALGCMEDYARLTCLAKFQVVLDVVAPTGTVIDLSEPSTTLSPETWAGAEALILECAAACRQARAQLIFNQTALDGIQQFPS